MSGKRGPGRMKKETSTGYRLAVLGRRRASLVYNEPVDTPGKFDQVLLEGNSSSRKEKQPYTLNNPRLGVYVGDKMSWKIRKFS